MTVSRVGAIESQFSAVDDVANASQRARGSACANLQFPGLDARGAGVGVGPRQDHRADTKVVKSAPGIGAQGHGIRCRIGFSGPSEEREGWRRSIADARIGNGHGREVAGSINVGDGSRSKAAAASDADNGRSKERRRRPRA